VAVEPEEALVIVDEAGASTDHEAIVIGPKRSLSWKAAPSPGPPTRRLQCATSSSPIPFQRAACCQASTWPVSHRSPRAVFDGSCPADLFPKRRCEHVACLPKPY